jgi:hypothetical protein
MAVTIGNFTAINDSEVVAESPITESLMTRLRDNAYWVNAGTTQTTESTATKYLKPDGSGGVEWGDTSALGVDGTKGNVSTVSTMSGTPDQIAIETNRILMITWIGAASANDSDAKTSTIIVDASDDTFVYVSGVSSGSGTITGSYTTVASVRIQVADSANMTLNCQKNGSNYEFYSSEDSASDSSSLAYIWL